MLRKFSLSILLLLAVLSVYGQGLKVDSFTHDPYDLSARLDTIVKDLNGNPCALLKVMVMDDITHCHGGNVKNIVSKRIVKYIYVSPSATHIQLGFKHHDSLTITFADYGFKGLTSLATYEVAIVDVESDKSKSTVGLQSGAQQISHNKDNNLITSSDVVSRTSIGAEDQSDDLSEKIYSLVEEMPEFPNGGISGLYRYFAENVIYPEDAIQQGIYGRVVCSFVVHKDGSISDVIVVKHLYPSLDEEAIRLIKSLPRWKPAMHHGKRVSCTWTCVVMFRLP